MLGFPGGSVVKNLPANVGDAEDMGSIPGWGRSPREGNGNPLQDSRLGNPMDRGAWRFTVHGLTKNWIQLRGWAELSDDACSQPPKQELDSLPTQRATCREKGDLLGPEKTPWARRGQGRKGGVLPSSCLKELWLFVRRTQPALSNMRRINTRPTQTKQKLEKGAELVRN